MPVHGRSAAGVRVCPACQGNLRSCGHATRSHDTRLLRRAVSMWSLHGMPGACNVSSVCLSAALYPARWIGAA